MTSKGKYTDIIKRSEFISDEEFEFLAQVVHKVMRVSMCILQVRIEIVAVVHSYTSVFIADRCVEILNELEDKAQNLKRWSNLNHVNSWMPSSDSEVVSAIDTAQDISYRLEDFIKIYDTLIEKPEFKGVKNQQGLLRHALMADSSLIQMLHQYRIDKFYPTTKI